MNMFDEAEARVKREEHDSGDKEAFHLKGLMDSVSQTEPCNVI